MKYEQAKTFDEVVEVAKKKESMEKVPWLTVQSMAKAVQFLIELELRKHPKVNSYMESTN